MGDANTKVESKEKKTADERTGAFLMAKCVLKIPSNIKQTRHPTSNQYRLKRRVFFHDLSYLLLIGGSVFFEEVICFRLSRRLRIRIVQQILDA